MKHNKKKCPLCIYEEWKEKRELDRIMEEIESLKIEALGLLCLDKYEKKMSL